MDCLHKHTIKFVDLCKERDIGTIVLGDLTGIRNNINYGKRANQKLHQWAFDKITQPHHLQSKSSWYSGENNSESYTSQTCPHCGHKKKPSNRNYHCKQCDFKYHRDGVGAMNIRAKYLGCFGNAVLMP